MSAASYPSDVRFILALWCDLSLTTGYSINERESALALLNQFPEQIRVICPEPEFPHIFEDSRIDYVHNHRRHDPYHHLRFVFALRRRLRELLVREPRSAAVFRLGPVPIVPALTVRDGVPVILKTFKVPWPTTTRGRRWSRRLARAGASPLYRYITSRSLGLDVESRSYARWVRSHLPISASKVAVVPNGANVDDFCPQDRIACRRRHGWQRFDYVVGYVGAIDALRSVEDAVQALGTLRDLPGVALVLVGDGPLLEPLRRRVTEEGLGDRVLLPGPVPYEDVPSVINAFDVAIDLTLVPFHTEGEAFFGSFSQKISQYLACGVPVVAWETPDTMFLDQSGVGRTAPPRDAVGLARVLRGLANKQVRPTRSDVRRFAIDQLSTDVIARQRMRLWTRLVDRSPHLSTF